VQKGRAGNVEVHPHLLGRRAVLASRIRDDFSRIGHAEWLAGDSLIAVYKLLALFFRTKDELLADESFIWVVLLGQQPMRPEVSMLSDRTYFVCVLNHPCSLYGIFIPHFIIIAIKGS
jgi:hypothetical protein